MVHQTTTMYIVIDHLIIGIGGENLINRLCKAKITICSLEAGNIIWGNIIWATTRENLSWGGCEQQRCRPACVFASSDQRLCNSLIRKYYI